MFHSLKNKIRYEGLKLFKAQMILTLDVFVKDEKGKIINKFSKVSDSLTGNFLQILYTQFSEGNAIDYLLSNYNGGNNTDTKKVGGSNTSTFHGYFKLHTLANDSTSGILFGTGTTPVTPLDFQIETLIAQGTGLGQFLYNQMQSSQIPTTVGNNTSFKIYRIATNQSGSPITINEIAVHSGIYVADPVCIYRDIIAGGLVVPSPQTVTAELTWNITT